jgi:hypothetical protein
MWTLSQLKKDLRRREEALGHRLVEVRRFLNHLHVASIQGGDGDFLEWLRALTKKKPKKKPEEESEEEPRYKISGPTMTPAQLKMMADQLKGRYNEDDFQPAGPLAVHE